MGVTVKMRHVIVTGASRGIGLQIARTMAVQGYSLTLVASSADSAHALQSEPFVIQANAKVCHLDLADAEQIARFCADCPPDIWGLVNNAGVCTPFGIDEEGEDPLGETIAVNLVGPYLLVRGLLQKLSRPGRIVNIASQLGKEGRAGYSAYCASKFGLIGMTKCWAKELGKEGITVNAICPGWVGTEMALGDVERMAREKGMTSEQFYRGICEPLELKRFNTTEEVAQLVSFLLSDQASGITGRDWLMQTIWNQS